MPPSIPPPTPAELARLRHALAASESRFFLLCQVTQEAIWTWDPARRRLTWSGARETLEEWGLPDELDLRGLLRWVHPGDRRVLRDAWRDHLRGRSGLLELELRRRHPEAGWRWTRARGVACRDADGSVRSILGTLVDIHAHRSAEARVAWIARNDPLTGLPNRAAMLDLLAERLNVDEPCFGVLLVDLDRFKTLNRTLGPKVGDQVLEATAERLTRAVGRGLAVGRIGADQFVVVTSDGFDGPRIEGLVDQLLAALAEPLCVDDHAEPLPATACIGIVHADRTWSSAHDLLRDAEQAVVQAKRQGSLARATFEAPSTTGRRQLSLEAQLRRALSRGDLELYYQPIVQLPSRQPVSFEALVRWFDRDLGPVPPSEFVPLAEECGLIGELGRWVLEEACATLSRWRRHPQASHLRMNVNLSALQFRDRGLVRQIEAALRRHPEVRGHLNLELTETALLERPGDQVDVLLALRDLGCEIHIDDFGTGYSSLSNLVRLPVDALKVDREFVGKAERDPRSRAVVQAVARMADELGLSLTAEGIETEAQARLVAAYPRARGQGYLFARPLAEPAAFEMMVEPTTVLREAG